MIWIIKAEMGKLLPTRIMSSSIFFGTVVILARQEFVNLLGCFEDGNCGVLAYSG